MPKIPRIRLRAGKAEKLRQQRHPWIFSGAFSADDVAESGETVLVTDEKGNPVAYAHWDADHSIRARVFAWIDRNKPVPSIDKAFWRARWQAALKLRQRLGFSTITNSYRLLNSEGDYCPGMIVDIYDVVAVLQLRTPGAQRLLPELVRFLSESLPLQGIYLRAETLGDSHWVWGTPQPTVTVLEYGLKFLTAIETGQKTGFFLDQRENRRLLSTYAPARRVANFFAYTGGFSLYAAAASAQEILSVEIMPEPTQLLEKNFALNGFDSKIRHTLLVEDAFKVLPTLEAGAWDIIILDPPAFTHHQDALPQALRGYRYINLQALKALSPGGFLFTFSCSGHVTPQLFRDVIFQAAMEADRAICILHFLHAAPDHPIDLFHPQGEYLKGFVLQVF